MNDPLAADLWAWDQIRSVACGNDSLHFGVYCPGGRRLGGLSRLEKLKGGVLWNQD